MKNFLRISSGMAVAIGNLFAAPSAQQLNRMPISFEQNRGQGAKEAEFVARGTGYYMEVGRQGSRMVLRDEAGSADVRTSLVGAEREAKFSGEADLPGHSSYFRGKDSAKWITGLANYGRVRAAGVYSGIDLIYYGNQAQLEYDFVVAPGADAGRIRMHFDGVDSVAKEPSGDLTLRTAAGNLVQHKPDVYQLVNGARRPVESEFRLAGTGDVSFRIGPYDHSLPLVIDPVLVFSSFLGGRDLDAGNAVAADNAGNMYMTGTTFSTPKGDSDALVRKISPDGASFVYTADVGGSDNDYGNGIAVDANGSAFVGGRTGSLDFPVASAFQKQNYGVNNAYVLKLDPAGTTLLFSTYIGGGNDDRGYAVAVDTQGSVYLTGISTSTDFPTNDGAFQRNNRGGIDAFVAKFGFDGTAIYSTLLGGGSDDRANGIAVDLKGNAYVVGETFSDSFPQANPPFQHSRHGSLDAFVAELNPDGSQLVFSTFSGGSGDDSAGGVAVDLAGNVYVVGSTTTDKGFDVPGRSYGTSYNGGASDIFVSKYTPGGQSLAWTTFLGSHGGDYGNAISVDANGTVYVAGDTDSNQYPVTRDAVQGNRGGGVDAVLSVLDTNGQNLLYSSFYGGSGDDSAVGLAVNSRGDLFVTGSTTSPDLAISQGAVQSLPGGGASDAFLAKVSVAGSSVPGIVTVAPAENTPTASSAASVFGRGMIAPTTEGRFDRRVHGEGAAIAPDRFERMGRSGGTVLR